jgi:hypothetical protein
MRLAKRFVPLAALVAAGAASPVAAQTVTVGAHTADNCIPFGCAGFFGITTITRYQEVFTAAAFSGAGGPIDIVALTFFNSFNPTGLFSNATYSIFLSTTSVAVGALSTNLSSNVGANNAAFATVTTSGSPTGSQVTFTGTPFLYNPLQGNLLMDILLSAVGPDGSNGTIASFQAEEVVNQVSRAFTEGNGTVITGGSGLVTRFTYSPVTSTPEPATLSLLATGLAGLATWRRRSIRKASV